MLGLIEVGNHSDGRPVADDALQTLVSFSLQAAVAISDAQVQQDAGRWKEQLDDISRLDDVLNNVEQLDNLAGGQES